MTARDLTAGVTAAIQDTVVYPAILYEGEFASSQHLRLWTGVGALSWDSKTWTGGGSLLGISPLEETRDVKAVGFTVTVSGIESAKVSLALQSVRQNKPATLWLALFNAAGAMIADPYRLRDGRFDIAVIEDNGETCTIAAQYEDRTIDLDRARDRRYTHEDQQLDYPGDLGFEFVSALQDMQIMWGGPAAAASPLATPSGGVPETGAPNSTQLVDGSWATYNDTGQLASLTDANQEDTPRFPAAASLPGPVPETGAPNSTQLVDGSWATYNDTGQLASLTDANQEDMPRFPATAASPLVTPTSGVPETGAPNSTQLIDGSWATYNDAGQLVSLTDDNQAGGD